MSAILLVVRLILYGNVEGNRPVNTVSVSFFRIVFWAVNFVMMELAKKNLTCFFRRNQVARVRYTGSKYIQISVS